MIFEERLRAMKPKRQSRYIYVAQDISEKIGSGEYAVGTVLPTEFQLSDIYQVSRHTIREALRKLQDLGLILRQKRTGTVVLAAKAPSGFRQSLSSLEDLAQFSAKHLRQVQECIEVTADDSLANEFGFVKGKNLVRISSLRLDSDSRNTPLGWTDVYIEAEYADIIDILKQDPKALISALIETNYSRYIAEIKQTISAVELSESIAKMLKVKPGSSALKIIRHYTDNAGKVFEATVSYHPSDKFSLTMLLKRVSA